MHSKLATKAHQNHQLLKETRAGQPQTRIVRKKPLTRPEADQKTQQCHGKRRHCLHLNSGKIPVTRKAVGD